jgi:hypothetical protein
MSAIAELEQCVARLSLEASEARRLQRRMRGAVTAASVGAAGGGEGEAAKKKGKNRKKKKKVAAVSSPAPPPAIPAPAVPPVVQGPREGAGGGDSDLLNALHSVSMLDRRADEYRERLRVLKVRRAGRLPPLSDSTS